MNAVLFGVTPEPRVTRLANGFTIATETMPQIATASVGVWIGAGSRHERESEHGLSHFLEHMAFKGTATRSARAIAEEIESVGGDINAATSVEYTAYTARTLGEDLGVALDILGDIITASAFDGAELERERGVVLQEIAAVDDDPDDLIQDVFVETAFPAQPIGRRILGTRTTVKGFTADAIRAFVAREYRPDRMVLAAAGAVDHDRVVETARRFFEGLPAAGPGEPEAGFYRGGEARLERDLEQANLVLGLPGVSFKDPAHYATQILSHVLGGGLSSRLWQEVRETRGLAYGIDAFHWPFSDTGLFGIGAGTAGEDLAELVDVTLGCLDGAARGTEAIEVARAKAGLKVSLLAALEAPGGRIERMARQLLSWGRIIPTSEVVGRVDAVGVDEVRSAGESVLRGPMTLAAIGPIRGLPSRDRLSGALARP
ncbi:M16 family metallopeptidase [Salinarimonas soli]|uniref:Insulinase family protein n=1 Tax=Salinarimonas soli TaxID=1638099 RepID=A0A5B2VXW8_9HYPH|nr:pitrilysin family protein [Salinarimonas soli]KAA2244221.1 insulinase family protein [Salinarimonas soli]